MSRGLGDVYKRQGTLQVLLRFFKISTDGSLCLANRVEFLLEDARFRGRVLPNGLQVLF